jgi:hypothetical protein
VLLLKAAAITQQFPIEREPGRPRPQAMVLRGHNTWHHLIENGTYGLISSSKQDYSRQVNGQRSSELYHQLVARGHKPVPATGYYGESGKPVKPERSFLVRHDNVHELHQHMLQLANHYQQESVIIRHQGKHYMLFPHGNRENPFPHYLEGRDITHWPTEKKARTILHTGIGQRHSFRQEQFGENPPQSGIEPPYLKSRSGRVGRDPDRRLHKHIAVHTTWGTRHFTLHFDPTPRPLRGLRYE